VNIEAIIRDPGIELDKKADLDGEIAGQLERTAAGYRIAVNKSDHYFRKPFTMAHELGHFMLHGHLIGEGRDDNTGTAAGSRLLPGWAPHSPKWLRSSKYRRRP